MTDRELLEFAAKAAGIEVMWIQSSFYRPTMENVEVRYFEEEIIEPWNPLTNDGDAFRLAVKLSIQVTGHANGVGQAIWNADNPCGFAVINEENLSDPYAATRRAIVRAAAAIGRAMP